MYNSRPYSLWRRVLLSCVCLSGLSVLHSELAYGADDTQSRIIVKWKAAAANPVKAMTTASEGLRSAMGVGLAQRRNISDRMDVVELDAPLARTEFTKALAKLNTQSDVEFAVADERRFAHALPDDPYFTATSGRTGQWYLQSVEVAAANAQAAWDLSTGGNSGNGVIVAVVDTGVRFDHPDLADKLLPGYDFVSCDQSTCSGSGLTYLTANDGNGWDSDASDPGDWLTSAMISANPSIFGSSCTASNSSWHGTRVSGIIGAASNNGVGIAGTGYNVRILPVRVLGRCGGYDSDIIAGMRWAAGLSVSDAPSNPYPAKVINLSLGGSGTCSSAYTTAISAIRAAGVSIVASAGNDSAITNTPANCAGVIGVAGVRNTGTKVGFSSLGTAVAISAPAGNCVNSSGACLYSIDTTTNLGTTTPSTNSYTDQTNYNLGTSFSAPIVSGTIGLMLGANSALTPDTVTSRLKATVTAFPTNSSVPACVVPTSTTAVTTNQSECNCTTSTCGAGIVNANKAVISVKPPVISITGATSLNGGDSTVLDASASTAADNNALTYAWSVISGNASLSSNSTASTTITVPDLTEAVVVKLTATDDWANGSSQTYSIAVTSSTNSSASSSASSTSSASSSTTSSTAVSASSSTTGSSGGGGGRISWTLLAALSGLLAARRYSLRSHRHAQRASLVK